MKEEELTKVKTEMSEIESAGRTKTNENKIRNEG